MELLDKPFCSLVLFRAHHGDFLLIEVEQESRQKVRKSKRLLGREAMEEPKDRFGSFLERFLTREAPEPKEVEDPNGIRGRQGVIVRVLGAGEKGFAFSSVKEAAAGPVPKLTNHLVLKGFGLFDPVWSEARFIKIEEPLDEKGIVFRNAFRVTSAILKNPEQSIALLQLIYDERGRFLGSEEVALRTGGLEGFGEARDRQTVPRGQDLFIAVRLGPPLPFGEKSISPFLQKSFELVERDVVRFRKLLMGLGNTEDTPSALKISWRLDPIGGAKKTSLLLAQDPFDLFRSPKVIFPFFSLAIRILSGIKPSPGIPQIALNVAEGLFSDPSKTRFVGCLIGLQKHPSEQSIIVKHLFEVGNEPSGVHRIAMEASSQVVVNPPFGHLPKRVVDHGKSPFFAGSIPIAEEKRKG